MCEKWLKRLEETEPKELNKTAVDEIILWVNVHRRNVKKLPLPSEPVILLLGKHTLRK